MPSATGPKSSVVVTIGTGDAVGISSPCCDVQLNATLMTGALLLVSDQPMVPEGIKTEASDLRVTTDFVEKHITIGIEALKLIRRHGKSVKHLRFDE